MATPTKTCGFQSSVRNDLLESVDGLAGRSLELVGGTTGYFVLHGVPGLEQLLAAASLVCFQVLLCVAGGGVSRGDGKKLHVVCFHRASIPRGGRFKESWVSVGVGHQAGCLILFI